MLVKVPLFSSNYFDLYFSLSLSGPSPNSPMAIPLIPNCIVTLSYGQMEHQELPPVMFTSDPKFRDKNYNTVRRMRIRSDTEALFNEYGIQPFQVFWYEGGSNYVPKSREILEFYGAMSQVSQKSVIFHDAGNAFMSDGE